MTVTTLTAPTDDLTDTNEASGSAFETPEPTPQITPEEYAELVAAQKDAQKIIERAPTSDVPLSQLQGMEIADQFYLIWGTPERGQALWEAWRRTLGPAADNLLDQFAASTAEELGMPIDEARWRIAVDKVLNDCGPQFAVKFMERYYAAQLQKSRTLQPMAQRRRKK